MPALKPSCLTTLPHTVNSVRNNNYHLCNELLYIVFLLGDFHQQRAKKSSVLVIILTLQQLPPSKFYANQHRFSEGVYLPNIGNRHPKVQRSLLLRVDSSKSLQNCIILCHLYIYICLIYPSNQQFSKCDLS